MNAALRKKRIEAAEALGGRCAICEKKFGKRFQFHHVYYPDGWLVHSDFSSNARYNEYILPKIVTNPEIFRLLCHTCHRLVSIIQSIKDDGRFERLVATARESRVKTRG